MRFGKTPVIKFAAEHDALPIPSPAKNFIPEWYKKAPRFIGNEGKPKIQSSVSPGNKGVKICVPFLDGLTHGYMAELWQDIQVSQTPEGPRIEWPVEPVVLKQRPGFGLETLPIPAGHLDNQFVWMNPYTIETPPGYSVLITHPLNRFDLPFTTLSGVVDSDAVMGPGHLPFYLQEGFEGIIPAGTPIFQIIPIKRTDWDSEHDPELRARGHRRMWEASRKLYGDYKARVWTKKNFN